MKLLAIVKIYVRKLISSTHQLTLAKTALLKYLIVSHAINPLKNFLMITINY